MSNLLKIKMQGINQINLLIIKIIILFQNILVNIIRSLLFYDTNNKISDTILVYRTARLGDFIVANPAFVKLRSSFPKSHIILLTTLSSNNSISQKTKTYMETNDDVSWVKFIVPSLIDEVYILDSSNWFKSIKNIRNIFSKYTINKTFILPFTGEDGLGRIKKMILFKLLGVNGSIYGYRVFSTTKYMRQTQYINKMFNHQVWSPLHALAECALIKLPNESEIKFEIAITEQIEKSFKIYLEKKGCFKRKIVAISPGSTYPHKRWSIDKYISLCNKLAMENKYYFVIIGSKIEKIYCDKLCATLGKEHLNLCGQTNIQQLATLFKCSDLFLGNDGGSAHLASAVNCPCVTVSSSIEYPGLWEPWNSRSYSVRHHVSCEFCFSYTDCPLGTRECIEDIEVELIYSMCKDILNMDVKNQISSKMLFVKKNKLDGVNSKSCLKKHIKGIEIKCQY